MKKLLITAYSLEMGGIEKALVNLLRLLDKTKYDITLVLEHKAGFFLDQIPKEVHLEEYCVHDDSFMLLRKIKNRLKLWKWGLKHRNKYDFSISFATYSIPGSHIARIASRRNALWIHNNYYQLYDGNITAMEQFFQGIKAEKFLYHIYVSHENKDKTTQYFPSFREKAVVCNNPIDYQEMYRLSKEKINHRKPRNTLFVNIGRHEEHQKRLSRIIEAAKRLKEEGFSFTVWFIGNGPDTKKYQKQVRKAHLQDVIVFLGQQKNPYPYYKKADALLLSSEYEGYPVVFVEAMTLGCPIVTTKVSDYDVVDQNYGIVVSKSKDGVYQGMKQILTEGFQIRKTFSPKQFNEQILLFLDSLFKPE